MSIVSSLIADLQAGVPEPKIASQYSWPGLSIYEREEIYSRVQTEETYSKSLLRLVVQMALTGPGCDPWDEARILSLGIQYMGWENSRQRKALDQLRLIIDQLEEDFSVLSTDDQGRLTRYKAEYFELHARCLVEEDQVTEAINTFTQSLDLYHQFGERKLELRVKQQIHDCQKIKRDRWHIIPINQVDNERLRLQKELADLNSESNLKANEFKRLNKELQDLQESRQRQAMQLQADREQVEQEITRMREQNLAAIDQVRQELEIVTAELNENKTLLQFFRSLSALTTGPLWLEVVKMALEQGEMDDLALQVLQRLVVHFPEQSNALLVEVFARLSESSSENMLGQTTLMNNWILKLQQAEQVYRRDKMIAAHLIVEAWEEFCHPD